MDTPEVAEMSNESDNDTDYSDYSDLCNYKAKSEESLSQHIVKKHDDNNLKKISNTTDIQIPLIDDYIIPYSDIKDEADICARSN